MSYRCFDDPLEIIRRKRNLSQSQADAVAWIVLPALDAAKRGRLNNPMSEDLYEHLLTSGLLWKLTGNQALMGRTQDAINAMGVAYARPGDCVALTTGEYQTLRTALGYYLRNLTRIEVGSLADANLAARKHMGLQ